MFLLVIQVETKLLYELTLQTAYIVARQGGNSAGCERDTLNRRLASDTPNKRQGNPQHQKVTVLHVSSRLLADSALPPTVYTVESLGQSQAFLLRNRIQLEMKMCSRGYWTVLLLLPIPVW